MMPIGPLMIEHRLIERMIGQLQRQLDEINRGGRVDPVFIETAVDFLGTYADRTHHGKEEDILFRELVTKDLSRDHQKTMDELVEEHVYARKRVGALLKAKEAYAVGDEKALDDLITCLEDLIEFYPLHIVKEDKRFFIPCMDYFNQQEQDHMLNEFWDFDREMIHEKYEKVVERYEDESVL